MDDKKQLKEMANAFREAADVLDEVVENTDETREDELLGKFVVKMMKIEKIKEGL